MQAIILAAGMGKRLGELTKNNTKCMVEVGGVRLIERALRILDRKKLAGSFWLSDTSIKIWFLLLILCVLKHRLSIL